MSSEPTVKSVLLGLSLIIGAFVVGLIVGLILGAVCAGAAGWAS